MVSEALKHTIRKNRRRVNGRGIYGWKIGNRCRPYWETDAIRRDLRPIG